ncbi:metallophosphoesterase [Maricaulis sp.]|uniref:metallophosphoesterase n=1 Tax=Maricaulis sp. TaxID=1486257 RepID=UPI003A930B53
MIHYAIGDLHGCLDELKTLLGLILQDHENWPGACQIVLLGDYVDRGPDSKGVLDLICKMKRQQLSGYGWGPVTSANPQSIIALPGNHEELFLDLIQLFDEKANRATIERQGLWWLENGGLQTLQSYVANEQNHPIFDPVEQMKQSVWRDVIDRIPVAHIRALEDMLQGDEPYYIDEKHKLIFVHAGIIMKKPLEEHDTPDFLWSRDTSFLLDTDADWVEPYTVVHGHTPADEPRIRNRRIGVDTGCFETGVLTAARFVCGELNGFLST